MANKIIKLKRGNAETWRKINPVLNSGEPAFEIDTFKLKIGDGSTLYNDLPYIKSNFKVSADMKSVVISGDDNTFSLKGFKDALIGQFPSKGIDGLEWISFSDKTLSLEEVEGILV